ncbi:glycosyltransferase [Salinirubellus salinus]|uniref:Glycosyltransferase n=1 Tax=Salinirubellus salinus TaxID=1364945 RepID=A0A9E7R2C3_9EURY|nr:glycosyltransferase [Salinirubellus salinus]UWM54247.1 glycosyltransferase [Salinirubellus salinus]
MDRFVLDETRLRTDEWLGEQPADPKATVVVVTHDVVTHTPVGEADLRDTFEGLKAQTTDEFELVVVSTRSEDLRRLLRDVGITCRFVEMTVDYGANAARNIGAALGRGDVVVFLDHDAIPAETFVEEHLLAHEERDVVAVRGRLFVKTASVYNRLQAIYDFGERSFPYLLDHEANASVDRETYLEVGGFDEDIWGHEGAELTKRLLEVADREEIRYVPGPVVYHDYAVSFWEVLEKKARHQRAKRVLRERDPETFAVYSEFPLPEGAYTGGRWEGRLVYVANRITEQLGNLMAGYFQRRRNKQSDA